MDKIILCTWCVLFILPIGLCQNNLMGEVCTTNVYNGTCVVITSCPSAMSLVQLKDIATLRSMLCGFAAKYPMVCCPLPSESSSIIFNNKTEETATSRPKKTTTPKPEDTTTLSPDIPSETFPNRGVCGQAKSTDRIFGGVIADIDEFPWLARIKYYNNMEKEVGGFACSASLITDRYLITAAHCVGSGLTTPISVRLGEWDEQTAKDCMENNCNDKPVDINISKIIIHPKYNKKNATKYDIALLQLSEPVAFTDFIQPICLPTTEYIAMQDYVHDSSYWTAGWGLTEYGQASPIKRKVKLEAVPTDVCQGILPVIPKSSFPNLICAGGRQGKDSCKGDSGGPLMREVAENYQNNWFLFGITSFGTTRCGTEGVPGLYTRVTSYMDWIRSIIDS